MIDLFHPPKPPQVNPQDCAVVHTFMDTTKRYHDKGRQAMSLTEYLASLERKKKRNSEYMRKYRRR